MGLTVDTIESLLVAKVGQYVKDMDTATQAHVRWRNEVSGNADRSTDVAAARKIATVKRVADTEKVEAKSAAAAVKAAEREKQAAIRETEKAEAAAASAARRRIDTGSRISPATSGRIGATVANEVSGQRSIPASVLNGEVSAQREINHTLADQADIQARLTVARGADRDILRDQLTEIKLIGQYRRAGLNDEETAIRLERQLEIIEAQRNKQGAVRAAQLERQMRANSSGVSSGIRATAGVIVGGFTIREISQLNDEYIKLQNQLRIAGLEGSELERVQDRLFASANRGGVGIGQLAKLYAGLVSLQKDLGISQEQTLTVTDAVANAIKIQGTTAESARGAILGLTQAFTQTTVQASEYNQIVEGLRPLLQGAVEASDKYKGSLGALRTAVLDGAVSSRELFQLVENGAAILQEKASKAALTTAQGFTVLTNALTVYFGEADKANGVSAAFGEALAALANNLNIVIPALAIIAVGLGVGYVTSAIAARIATQALGASLLAAFGGPIGIAITALVVGIGYAVASSNAAAVASRNHAAQADKTAQAISVLNNIMSQDPSGGVAKNTRDLAAARYRLVEATVAAAKAENALRVAQAQARVGDLADGSETVKTNYGRGGTRTEQRVLSTSRGRGGSELSQAQGVAQLELNAAIAQQKLNDANLAAALRSAKATIAGGGSSSGASPAKVGGTGAGGGGRSRIDGYQRDLDQANAALLSALQQSATTEAERVSLELEGLELARTSRNREIASDAEKTAAQKAILIGLNDQASAEQEKSIRAKESERLADETAQAAHDATDNANARLQTQIELAQGDRAMARTAKDRLAIENRIIDLQYQIERAKLEELVASTQSSDAEKQAARDRLRVLPDLESRDRAQARSGNSGPWQDYINRLPHTADEIRESFEQAAVNGVERLNDSLASSLSNMLGLHGAAGQFLEDLIKIGIQAAESAIFGGGSGGGDGASGGSGGGILGPILSFGASLFGGGHAGGGRVSPGKFYKVNEFGTEGYAAFDKPGKIIPLGEMHNSGGGRTTVINQRFTLDARYGITTPELLDHVNQVASVQAARAGKASFDASQQAAPGRLKQYQTLEA